jgi:hypothetical protein
LKRRSVVQQTGVDVGPSRPLKTNSAYVATCLELPSLSWLDGDEVAVLYGLKAVARTAVADMLASGERPPEAFDDKNTLAPTLRTNCIAGWRLKPRISG